MASRAVMKESSKWRSCRALERVTRTGPSSRGGEMPQAFAEDEGIAAEDDGDVVMPAAEGTAFVVIQSKLALEILIHALGAPAFLGDPDELLAARRFAHPRERVVRRGLLALGPLDQEPVLTAVDVASVHLDHGESRQQSAAASLPPRGWTERTAWEPAAAGVTFGDVLADGGYGVCAEFRRGLSQMGLRWAVGISPDTQVYAMSTKLRAVASESVTGRPRTRRAATAKPRSVRDVIASLGPHALWTVAWRRGTKGMLSAEFCALRIPIADGEPVLGHRHGPGDEVWLICERRSNGETKYHLSNYPPDASLETIAAALKARWACEQAHQQMKEELGLDHFEGRSWSGLHHHALLTMIAFAFLQHLRKRENKAAA